MRTLPFEFKRQLAAGLSIGCGLAAALQMFGTSYDTAEWLTIATYSLSAFSLLLGFNTIPRLVSTHATKNELLLRRFVNEFSRLQPPVLAGVTFGFVLPILVAYSIRPFMTPFLLMIVITLTSIPHMLLYLTGPFPSPSSPTAREVSGPIEIREVIGATSATPEASQENDELSTLRAQLTSARNRMLSEVGALARRGNLNLAIGIFTTLAAVSLLASIVFTVEVEPSNTASVLAYYIPRISFVAFVEVFSFFFLKLYRTSLDGIKYFQNELTNIELRFIALEAALLGDRSQALGSLVSDLAKTERNFILKKGEATVELRRSEIEAEHYKQAMTAVGDFLRGIKTK